MNKKIVSIALTVVMVMSTVGFGFAWVKMRATLQGITVAMSNTPKLLIGKTESGSFGETVNANERYEIKCVSSTDGVTFVDENGALTSGYVTYPIYVKSDKKRGVLYVADILTSKPCEGLRVAVTYINQTLVFDPSNFEEQHFQYTTNTSPAQVTVRVWFEGSVVTEPVADDVTVSVVFGIEG